MKWYIELTTLEEMGLNYLCRYKSQYHCGITGTLIISNSGSENIQGHIPSYAHSLFPSTSSILEIRNLHTQRCAENFDRSPKVAENRDFQKLFQQ